MTGNGITQIVLYTVILTVLAYPLSIYMSRVYQGTLRMPRWLTAPERGFYRLVGTRAEEEQGWKGYAKTALVFMGVFAVLLYLLLRLQGHLPLNPDGFKGVNSWVSMNTTASFVTNTNWQYYGGEYTMSYLSQMAGLAVQNFVSAALGMAVLVAVIRGFARRSASHGRQLLGRSLPLARLHPPAARRDPRRPAHLPGRRADVRRLGDGDDGRGRAAGRSHAARRPRRSPSSSWGRTAAASTTRTRPSRSRTRTPSRTSSRCCRSC